ncbi:MAG TPA: sodium:solute symporter [Bryobacteraceae bacterium]|jgi:SSS family transporter|nr:sodium:solute symporter [Bryobacteraceae bacterium]
MASRFNTLKIGAGSSAGAGKAASCAIIRVFMHALDLTVIALYLAGITWFGARFRKSQRSLRDYFLGGKTTPWWAIALSIVSAETSTLTVIGTPALAFGGNFEFLQLVLGYLLARIAIAAIFLPHYFRGEMFTAYELMRRRFGDRIRKLTAGTFLVLRALAEGVRVFALSIIISVVLGSFYRGLGAGGTGELISILAIVVLTLFYTFEGGLTAVIWTDVVQMALYIAGAAVSFFVILHQIPGGWAHAVEVAAPLDKFQVFDFRLSWTAEFFSRKYSFWGGIIGGCFLTTASHGTEQLMVQRLLAARNERESRLALFSSWIVIFLQFSLFLLIGTLLFVHYHDLGLPAPQPMDRVYPEFVWRNLPPGVAGLVIAAILAAGMSNLSAALNSLSSTVMMDFLKPLAKHAGRDDAFFLRAARWTTAGWGVVLVLVGWIAQHWGSVLEAGLSIASILYGALLGVFLLGTLTRKPGEYAAMLGMAVGLVSVVSLRRYTSVAFTWYVLFGTAVTFAVGYLSSFFIRERGSNV